MTPMSNENSRNGRPPTPSSGPYQEDVSLRGPSPLMWTVLAVAEALGVSDDYVYGLVSRREIPCVRFGTNIRFHYSDVRAYVNRLRDASLDEAERHPGRR